MGQGPLSPGVPMKLTPNPSWEKRRQWWDRGFRLVGLAATFFGLAILLVFLVNIAVDVAAWFRTMPQLIERHNNELQDRAARADVIIREKMQDIDRQMQQAINAAATEQEKQRLRDHFEKEIKPRERSDMEATVADFKRDVNTIRNNTSAPALLGHFLVSGP